MPAKSDHAQLSKLNRALEQGDIDIVRRQLFELNVEERAVLEAELGAETTRALYRAARRRRGSKKGRVIVINGIMGALLDSVATTGDSDRVWINYFRLMWGRLSNLKLKSDGQPSPPGITIKTSGLHKSYLPMILELDADWHVLPFAFDWRLDMDLSAERLADRISQWANGEPVHIVAHSMGGLVSRRFIQKFPQLWSSMGDHSGRGRGGRLIMLGTPNRGSFAVPLIFSGKEKIVRSLAKLDFKHSLKEVLGIINTFIGSYQMLPSPRVDLGDDHVDLFNASNWGTFRLPQLLLDNGHDFQDSLHSVIDKDRMIYIAGYDQKTPHRLRIRAPGKFEYKETLDGDGRVPHELGLLEDVPTYWVREIHGDLPKNDNVLSAIHELLITGKSKDLEENRPTRRIPEKEDVWKAAEDVELVPEETKQLLARTSKRRGNKIPLNEREGARLEALLLRDYLGDTGEPNTRDNKKPAVPSPQGKPPQLNIEVIWGDITQASGDVYCVGHYIGVLPQAAEQALDGVISGKGAGPDDMVLRGLTDRGVLRGALGDVNFYPWAGHRKRQKVVAVAGMGHPGEFTGSKLRRLATDLAWAIGSLPDPRIVCTVLIGSGNGSLDNADALKYLLDGLADSIATGMRTPISKVRIVEYDLAKAHSIHGDLCDYRGQYAGINIGVAAKVIEGRGGKIGDGHALALAVIAAAGSAAAKRGTAKNRALQTILQSIPTEGGRKNRTQETLEGVLRSDNSHDIDKVAASLHVHLGSDDGHRKNDMPTRLAYTKEQGSICVAAIDNTSVVPKRDLRLDFNLVNELSYRTTDPDIEDTHELAQMLSTFLIPGDFRALLQWGNALILEVDRPMSNTHWEFMDNGAGTMVGKPYLALQVPLSRQLRTNYSPPPRLGRSVKQKRSALVIGDPGDPADDASLPGARMEAECVAKLLQKKGFEVVVRIGAPNAKGNGPVPGTPAASRLDVLNLINRGDFDLLHYAGHADFDPENPQQVGWLFKGGLITAAELEQLDQVPQLVIANACLSSRTSGKLASGEYVENKLSEVGLLPSLADEFFRRGVYNYIGTAWEVDDAGAVLFAETFYDHLLPDKNNTGQGETLGESMLAARNILYDKRDRFANLWAAYQHYGNPNMNL